MARAFTADQKALLRSPSLSMRALATFYLDSGTHRFCDDAFDMTDGTNTYIGANAFSAGVEIRSGDARAAEPVTLVIDGNRMTQYGVSDPAKVLRELLDYLVHQRRVDLALGFHYNYSREINLVIPVYTGKINYPRLVDEQIPFDKEGRVQAKLEIVLDSLAVRYSKATFRTRSNADQRDIDPTDYFYSFTADAFLNEKKLYWGKGAPFQNRGSSSDARWGGANRYRTKKPV